MMVGALYADRGHLVGYLLRLDRHNVDVALASDRVRANRADRAYAGADQPSRFPGS
jgi:hypothetical protein